MQLKSLIRFFTILLIIYSVYMLSFTWVVRSHENKMAAKAKQFVSLNYAGADSTTKADAYSARLKRLLDSTKDETVHFGITGAISYQKAKENELNLGLDLQGGINVTLEVELAGLLRSMANNSKDLNFTQALINAENRKANSSEDYVTLFVEEYRKLSKNAPLAPLFSAASNNKISPKDNDAKVTAYIREEANLAFDRTSRVLRTRIDQFGVAQPNINPDRERGIITVELPGLQDEDRVRKNLQSSANLQFWPTYLFNEYGQALVNADKALGELEKVAKTPAQTKPPVTDSADTSVRKTDTSFNKTDTGNKLPVTKNDTNKVAPADSTQGSNPLFKLMQIDQQNGLIFVLIRDTGYLRTYLYNSLVRRSFTEAGLSDVRFAYGIPGRDKDGKQVNFVSLYLLKTGNKDKADMEGDVITDAVQAYDQFGSKPTVSVDIGPAGTTKWERLTEASAKERRPIAIVLDDMVYSAPIASNKISGGRTEISGSFTVQEAQDLAGILKAGKLPAPAKIVAQQVVGPTLGADAIRGGITSFIIAFVVIFLLMLVYYNSSGWITNIALILNLLFTIGILTGLGATLTAPGIAGLILTIGLAVDTNVLTKERIKEELSLGKGYLQAVNIAFRRSLSPILDGHITVLLTAIILFSFGLGPVKGFATTQILGILLSLFSGILVTRWLTDAFSKKKVHFKYFTGFSRSVFQKAKFDFVGFRKKAFVISGIVLVLGISSFFNGFDYGVEFNGGRSYTVRFDKNVSKEIEPIRKSLTTTFEGESPVIKTLGNENTLNITTSYRIKEANPGTDSMMLGKLYQGLQSQLSAGTSYPQFTTNNVLGKTTVLPTISDDLKSGAKWATFWSIIIIALYIFIRFRDWRYSVGTIIALLHDVLVTLIVFSFAREIVPFPLEIDQHFIAALLTVIGFSMNEAIIIFDRIREDRKLSPNSPLPETINRAINETLSRTIMTSLTVFLTILVLFLLGGEVTKGFAFAMLIGVMTGVYSSMFVAAPMLINLGSKKKAEAVTTTPVKAKPQKV